MAHTRHVSDMVNPFNAMGASGFAPGKALVTRLIVMRCLSARIQSLKRLEGLF